MKDDFEKIYNTILENTKNDYINLNNLLYKRGILLIGNIVLIIFIIIAKSVIPKYYIAIIVLISILVIQIIIAIIFYEKQMKRYQYLYEKYIIKPIICEINKELLIEENKKINTEIYDNAEFEKYSNPIIGNSTNKYMYFRAYAGIHGKERERHIQLSGIEIGKAIDKIIFSGFFGYVTLNNAFYKDPIRIRNIEDKRQVIEYKNEQIKLESNLLLDYFNIFTKDSKKANEILNSINNEKIINLYNKNNKFEVTLKENKLYIRILSIYSLKGFPRKDPLKKEEIKKIYDKLKFTFELIDLFIDITDKK